MYFHVIREGNMKKLNAVGVMTIGALAMGSMAGVAMAGRAMDHNAVVGRSASDGFQNSLASFNASLTNSQRDALIKASQAWKPLADKGEAVFMARVQKDVTRILTPAQSTALMKLVNPSLAGGGFYFSAMCFSVSKIGLMFSLVGYIGCPGDVSGAATYDAYKASAYSTTCSIDNLDTCDSAVTSAGESYIGWSQLLSNCDVADTAAYSAAATYAFCGGTW